ncbi:hypothetical protein TNCV_3277141 [Trichonephila clavipes]|nr:hypothetical protein TNCV_3277141 [Trichonephila clavipes]
MWKQEQNMTKLQKTKLPVRLINTTNERRLVQGHETALRVKGDIEDVSSELDWGLKVELPERNAENSIALGELVT